MKTVVMLLVGALGLAAPWGVAKSLHGDDQKAQHDGSHLVSNAMSPATCKGFVVLPNGYAVLSGISDQASHPGESHSHHGIQQAESLKPMTGDKSAHDHPIAQTSKDHLMSLKHGDNIAVQPNRLCVPVDEKVRTQWKAVSLAPSLQVNAQSLRGTLAHNSRSNEGFEITVVDAPSRSETPMFASWRGCRTMTGQWPADTARRTIPMPKACRRNRWVRLVATL